MRYVLAADGFGHPMRDRMGGRFGWGLGGLAFLLLVTAGLVALAVFVARRGRPAAPGGAHYVAPPPPPAPAPVATDAALAHLRVRYARGEIVRDDFVQMSADLGAPIAPPESPSPPEPPTPPPSA